MKFFNERNTKLCILLGTFLFALFSVKYLYYKYEYFEDNLLQIVLSGFIILSIFHFLVILLTKYILNLRDWKLFHFKSILLFIIIFSVLFLVQLYRYNASLSITCIYGLKYIFLFIFLGAVVFYFIYKFFPD